MLCVFTCFWDSGLFQTLTPQGEPSRGSLQNKSCLKTYRRFFVRSGLCLNHRMKVEMTGRDKGCGRCTVLRAAALLSRSYAIVRGAHAHAIPGRRSEKFWCNFDESGCNTTATDCNSRREIAVDCTGLHRIALDCTCGQLRQKIKREKTRPEEKYPAPIFLPPSFCLQSGTGVPPPGGTSWREKTARRVDNGKLSIIP